MGKYKCIHRVSWSLFVTAWVLFFMAVMYGSLLLLYACGRDVPDDGALILAQPEMPELEEIKEQGR